MFKEKIIIEMKEVFKEIPFGIEHTLKVLKNAEDIMKGENIGEEEKEFISIIAILHDIGAVSRFCNPYQGIYKIDSQLYSQLQEAN